MKYFNKLSVAIAASAAIALSATVPLAPQSAAQEIPRNQQPSPEGSVLADRLSEMNENGAYFAETPYTEAPASKAVGRLLLGGSLCTGSVIDSPQGNLVLTAAHCVADWQSDGTWKLKDSVIQAMDNGQASITPAFDGTETGTEPRNPLGYWKITKAHIPASSGVDVAVLETVPNDQGQNIQSVTGAFGVRGLAEGEQVQASMIGYPAPAPFNTNSQSVCVGNYTNHGSGGNAQISRIKGERECWVGGGASGGPFVTNSSNPNLAGDIITVLSSGGGGNIAPLMNELYAAAGNSVETSEPTTETAESTEPTETAESTETTETTGAVVPPVPTIKPAETTGAKETSATASATDEPTDSEAATETSTTGKVEPSTKAEASKKPQLSTKSEPTQSESTQRESAKPVPQKQAHKNQEKKNAPQKKHVVKPADNIAKESKKVAKKDRPIFTTGGSLMQD